MLRFSVPRTDRFRTKRDNVMQIRILALVVSAAMCVTAGCQHNLAKNSCSDCLAASSTKNGDHSKCGCQSNLAKRGSNGNFSRHQSNRDNNHQSHHGLIGAHHGAHHGNGNDRIPRLPQGMYQQAGPAGPPTANVAYPYYTLRAPRDFLMANPPSIGP